MGNTEENKVPVGRLAGSVLFFLLLLSTEPCLLILKISRMSLPAMFLADDAILLLIEQTKYILLCY